MTPTGPSRSCSRLRTAGLIWPILPGIAAFVNLFPRELVTESASRMLTYAMMLGLSGQLAEAHAWLQRARSAHR